MFLQETKCGEKKLVKVKDCKPFDNYYVVDSLGKSGGKGLVFFWKRPFYGGHP